MKFPPDKIKILSDDNVLSFVELKNKLYHYRYIKSYTKKGNSLYLTETELRKLIEHNT